KEASNRDASILREVLKPQCALHTVLPSFILAAAVLARPLQVPELPERLASRFFDRHSSRGELFHPHLEVLAQLLVDLRRNGLRPAAEIPERPRPPCFVHVLGPLKHRFDRARVALPDGRVLRQTLPPRRRQRVETRSPVVLRLSQ